MPMNYSEESLRIHKEKKGKLAMVSKVPLATRDDLSVAYTPGVAAVSSAIAKEKSLVYEYTGKGNTVAIVTDGSAVLGLGNIGPEAALPVMEGKAVIFKACAGIDAYPIVLNAKEPHDIIAAVKAIAPTFGAINLEDIAAPKCFQIEERLRKELHIPVLHDDQWGTSVVVLAGLINALKLAGNKIDTARIVISGAGAAGSAIVKIFRKYGARRMLVVDRLGIIYKNRPGNSPDKDELAGMTNLRDEMGLLSDAMAGADVFIGVSSAGLVNAEMVRSMAGKAIVFALANPTPEILPPEAKKAGAFIAASGRSDFPNQLNNALSFPGIFRGALDRGIRAFTPEMLIAAAENLAALVKYPTPDRIIPSIFDKGVVKAVA